MYKLVLILRYLRKRRIAWVSLAAVTLCTTMVLVVISVMGGWLRMFRASFHRLGGDVVISSRSLVGFSHYEQMLQRIRALPEVKAAAPVIRTFGLVNISNQIRKGVEVVGYPPDIGQVNGFMESLYRTDRTKPLTFDLWPDEPYIAPPGYRGTRDVRTWKGMIVGTGVIGLRKDKSGQINRPHYMYSAFVDLTVLPVAPDSSAVNPVADRAREFFWIIDDSRTRVHIYDANTVYVAFDVLQSLLLMDGQDGRPRRTSDIQIALKPGVDPARARDRIQQTVDAVAFESGMLSRAAYEKYREGLERARRRLQNKDALSAKEYESARAELAFYEQQLDGFFPYRVQTWEQVHAAFIGAVEREKGLLTILFGLISIVAVFLIFCIFYMIVVEKTRDIGIIKSVGASSQGVAAIFLGYGAAIGIIGVLMGLGLAFLIVHNINELHDWLGRFGVVVWNPETYLFDTIPNELIPRETLWIMVVGVVASVAGALVPAIRAAMLHPVEALRWE